MQPNINFKSVAKILIFKNFSQYSDLPLPLKQNFIMGGFPIFFVKSSKTRWYFYSNFLRGKTLCGAYVSTCSKISDKMLMPSSSQSYYSGHNTLWFPKLAAILATWPFSQILTSSCSVGDVATWVGMLRVWCYAITGSTVRGGGGCWYLAVNMAANTVRRRCVAASFRIQAVASVSSATTCLCPILKFGQKTIPIQAYLGYIASLRQSSDFYPRIHGRESVLRITQ
jgi:hypothetical protein